MFPCENNQFYQEFGLSEQEILNIYPFGSRVYQTNSERSDYDFIIISTKNDVYDIISSDNKINAHIHSVESFQNQLNDHHIQALECLFLPKNLVLKSLHNFSFILDKNKLRNSISAKVSNSWVKAKKKMEVEKDRDIYIAKKSLFHSLRIIDFGIQIAQYDKIIDYSSSNCHWVEIINNPSENWIDYKNKYQEIFNKKMTEFRRLAPKG